MKDLFILIKNISLNVITIINRFEMISLKIENKFFVAYIINNKAVFAIRKS